MRLILDILTALGLGAAAGIRPFLPTLAAGAFAALNVGVDFDGTSFSWVESAPFLLAVLVALALAIAAQRRLGSAALERGPFGTTLGAIAIVLAGVLGAATFADHGYTPFAGAALGVGGATIARVAVLDLFGRVRARLDRAGGEALVVYGDGASLVTAIAAILLPPLSLLAVGLLGFLRAGGRRRAGERFAGLRILR